MNVRWPISAALVAALVVFAGCQAGPTVMNKARLQQVHRLVVVPLSSPGQGQPEAGRLAAGMIAERLQRSGAGRVVVLEAPVLWRMASTTAPDVDAAAVCRAVKADAVLVGKVDFLVRPPKLTGEQEAMARSAEYARAFVVNEADATVEVRVLPAGSAEPIYVHSGTAKGVAGSGPIRKAAGDAIAPLEEYLGRGGSSN